jgi:hypothetical protein
MNFRYLFAFAALAALIAPARVEAGAKKAAVPKTGQAGRPVALFNGKDLAGWVWVSRDPESKIEDVWSVVDGNLRCKGKPVGYIRTEAEYTNFALTMQIRHLKPGNGGVLVRVVGPDKVWPKSIEAQGQSGALGDIWNIDQFPLEVDPARTKGRQTVRLRPEVAEKPVGEWNDYEIVVDGGDLTLKVNGIVQNTGKNAEIVAGKIALQSEGSEYEFRDIVLRPLPERRGTTKASR